MLIGGREGKKSLIQLSLEKSLWKFLSGKRKLNFIVKEYPNSEYYLEQCKQIVTGYQRLSAKGYLVPPTARIIQFDQEKLYLLLTDMRRGGKYRVWGLSAHMTHEQTQELLNMGISAENFFQIRDAARNFIIKTVVDGVYYSDDTLHLYQEVETGIFHIGFLDLYTWQGSLDVEQRTEMSLNRLNRFLDFVSSEVPAQINFSLIEFNEVIGEINKILKSKKQRRGV